MAIVAGTSNGIFLVDDAVSTKMQTTGVVRDLIRVRDELFAGTGNGVWRSRDQGRSWQSSGLKDYEVWQIREAGESLLASTQPAGLFRSHDGGGTWHEIESFSQSPMASQWCVPVKPPLPGRARALVVDQANPDHIWVGVEVGGIMSTTDGGQSWTFDLPGGNPDLHMMFAQPDNPAVLYASTGYGRLDGVAEMIEGNAGVFRSEDAGASWQYAWAGITPRYSRPMCVDPHPPFSLTVASAPTAFSHYKEDGGAKAMLYRTEDGGDNWRSLCDAAHSPSAANIHGLAPDPDEPGGVVIGTDTGEVWQVTNAATWTLAGDGMPSVQAVLAA